jgi:hypothetical protein
MLIFAHFWGVSACGIKQSNDPFRKNPLTDLFSNCTHNTASGMRTAATEPNSSHFSTDSIREQIIEADTPVENVSLSQAKQVLEVKRGQNIHIMYVERFLKIFVDLFKKNTFDIFVGDRRDGVSVVGMVWGVLHEAIHDVVALRTESVIVNRGNGEIHEGSFTDAMTLGLVVGVHQKIHRVRIHVDRSFEQLLRRKGLTRKGLEFGQFSQCDIDLCGSAVVFNVLELIEHIFGEVLFSIFDQIEKCHFIGAIAQNRLRFDNLSIRQTNPNGAVGAIIQNFINFRIDPYFRTKIDSILSQNFREPAVAALDIPPFSFFTLLQLAHHVVQQHIGSGRMRDR